MVFVSMVTVGRERFTNMGLNEDPVMTHVNLPCYFGSQYIGAPF
jgi:hypothetical protein